MLVQLGMIRYSYVCFVVCVLIGMPERLSAGSRFQSLLDNNPFSPPAPKTAPVAPTPPPYEFRGVSVERGVSYFSVYNSETKKSVWIGPGNSNGGLKVKSHNGGTLVLVEDSGQVVSLALKEDTITPSSVGSLQPNQMVAATLVDPSPSAAPTLQSPEAHEIEKGAAQIRQRRAQRLAAKS